MTGVRPSSAYPAVQGRRGGWSPSQLLYSGITLDVWVCVHNTVLDCWRCKVSKGFAVIKNSQDCVISHKPGNMFWLPAGGRRRVEVRELLVFGDFTSTSQNYHYQLIMPSINQSIN